MTLKLTTVSVPPTLGVVWVLWLGLLGAGAQSTALAQAVSELPRAEYYLSRELLGAGRTLDAAEGFDTARSRARRIGELRWIDSVPPLVMRGECFYQQGNLGAALELYESALQLAIENPDWLDQLEIPGEQLPAIEFAKGVNWLPRSTPSGVVGVPAAIQLAVDLNQAQVGPQGGIVAPVSLVTRLDATEVFQTLGLALVRRREILGPHIRQAPLTIALDQYFSQNPRQTAAWVVASWSTLRGLNHLGSLAPRDAAKEIRQGARIAQKFDYFLTPLALLVLADLEAQQGSYQLAIQLLGDASLLAAQFEQHPILAEIAQVLGSCGAASSRVDLVEPLQNMSSWLAKRSTIAFVAASVGAAELAVLAGDLTRAEKLANQASTPLRQRGIVLPRLQARLAHVKAQLAFATNRQPLGKQSLNEALQIMQGSAELGAFVPTIFQTQLTLDRLAAGTLSAQSAESLLGDAIAEPSALAWQNAPLETLATVTTARIPAYLRHLELARARGADAAELLELMDRVQRERLYEALPLGGRLFSWRKAIVADPQTLSAADRQAVDRVAQANPELPLNLQRMEAAVQQLRQEPIPLDERKLSASAKKPFASVTDLAGKLESEMLLRSVGRIPLERSVPQSASLPLLQSQLADGELLLGFLCAKQQALGVAVTNATCEVWTITNVGAVDAELKSLATEIGLVRTQGAPVLPSAVQRPDAAWRSTALELCAAIFPDTIRDQVAAAKRIIIAPSERLWYVPFELLPDGNTPHAAPWIANHPIVYIPTLGSLAMANAGRPAIQDTLGIVGGFFALDRETNAALARQLIAVVPDSQLVSLSQKILVPSADWLRLRIDQLWVAAEVPAAGWETQGLALGPTRPSSMGGWLELPFLSPLRVLMPGMATSLRSGVLQQGDDLFLPACALMYSGTQSAVLSRWATGGKSSQYLMQRYLQELATEASSTALRRSLLAHWAEQYLIADEPALQPAGDEDAQLIHGTHPLLWSGYMAVGDTAP
ncbi:CHAT domain-containing protein [Aureliella helgolandensis]|uniref:CHAT domain protein n=1 Tax=Aureliella helgolandensis TaxID=2527968 RepID=A0A518GGG8_9BACT|nr:CHAT domain-containing protein [Aureliella helgolandensis]QDV27686.1 CHAT domain protein [Aureliella helgolandensis]